MAWIYESREMRYRYHATPKEAFDCPDAAKERASAIDTVPRRNRVELMTAAELAIRTAMSVVEEAGCDPLLTDAVVLLGQAQGKVADFVDRAG